MADFIFGNTSNSEPNQGNRLGNRFLGHKCLTKSAL
jgi:hypothetical protein